MEVAVYKGRRPNAVKCKILNGKNAHFQPRICQKLQEQISISAFLICKYNFPVLVWVIKYLLNIKI